jgi:hypothetical protein
VACLYLEGMQTERLTEYVDNRGQTLRVDTEKCVIHGVKILGFESANNRSYKPAAVSKAKSLYEGARVNVNHTKGATLEPRGYQDRLGSIKGVTEGQGGLYGNLHYNPKHVLAEQLVWDAQNAPENVGLSPVHTCQVVTTGGRKVVEGIEHVHSVDLVADPATNKTLFEHHSEDDSVSLKDLTLEQLREQRSDLIEKLLAEQSQTSEAEGLKTKSRSSPSSWKATRPRKPRPPSKARSKGSLRNTSWATSTQGRRIQDDAARVQGQAGPRTHRQDRGRVAQGRQAQPDQPRAHERDARRVDGIHPKQG